MNQPVSLTPVRRDNAAALVVVLIFLALIMIVIVAFLSTVTTELQSADVYESGVTVKQLVSTATAVVNSQILEGTRSQKMVRPPGTTGGIPPGSRLAWASQPGLIRTWDDTGAGWKLFKLYSARTLVADFNGSYSTADNLATEVPSDWPQQAALYTDLNAPVVVEDPAGGIVRGAEKYRASFPIVDPLALQEVDGFSITNPVGFGGSLDGSSQPVFDATTDPTLASVAGKSGNPAPMPVAWIYVLKDGTLTTPTGSRDSGLTAHWQGADAASTPSRANPIVGRIAFWTDDESCKLNINTASEPTPWDTPRGISIQDLNYGRFQPAQREFQRFPGHPFMTALSPVLFSEKVRGPTPLTAAQKELIYDLIPRVARGGTAGGTTSVSAPIVPDGDRLFANVDEFLFEPSRTAVTKDSAYSTLALNTARLRRAGFFLTANSRAPELNLFGQPRVALWPVNSTAGNRSAYDKLAAFCGTIGDASTGAVRPFYFQRSDSLSPKADYDNISRNRELYAYLQRLTGSPLPGYGGSFLAKWGQDRDQVLTEVFDYIRCVNLRDTLTGATPFANTGQVTPIQINNTQGFGRFHTISQFGFHFICAQDGPDGANEAVNPALSVGQRAIEAAFILEPFSPALGWYQLQENLVFEVNFTSPFSINGQDLKMQSSSQTMSDSIGNGYHGRRVGGAGGIRASIASFGGGAYAYAGKAAPRVKVPAAGGTMSFSGGTVDVKVYAGGSADPKRLVQHFTLNFPGGAFPIPGLVRTGTTAYRGANATEPARWWTFNGYQPLTGARQEGRYSGSRSSPQAPGPEYPDPTRRFVDSGGPPGFKEGGIFRAEDVVRSIVPDHGDIRLVAAQKEVAANQFVKVRTDLWEDPSAKFLHIFQAVAGPHHYFGFCNEPGPSPASGIPGAAADDQLFASAAVPMHYSRLPEIRPGAGKLYNRWGDFDNSVATWTDGAYINKPDEGNLSASVNVGGISYPYFSWDFSAATANYFSPSRLIPSAGMFGSLPTGVKRHTAGDPHAWETLLFRPEVRTAGGKPHPGTLPPKDYLLMDLFWMPVLEPYAISEPFSTAGKVNLNYEIAPFSYLRRATALQGALKSEEPLAMINAASRIYKLWDHETNDWPNLPNSTNNQDPVSRADWNKAANGQAPFDKMRRPIDAAKTLAQADARFAAGNAFRSATEICELHLVRIGENLADYQSGKIWQGALITGDNTRERPYTNLYGKLTTRSNTFTVHIRAQVLRQSGGAGADFSVWREGRDAQLAEHRGSVTIERYIDPSDPALAGAGPEADFAQNPDLTTDNFFHSRIVSTKKFVP